MRTVDMRCASVLAALIVCGSVASRVHAQVTPVSFAERRDLSVAGSPMGVTTGDFDGDGIPDIAAANNDVEIISVLFGNGNGSFTRRDIDVSAELLGMSKIIEADVNDDGAPDLVASNEFANSVTVLINHADGSGTFRAPRFATVGDSPEGLAVGHFNADGALDVATADQFGQRVSILLGNGDGSFRDVTSVAVVGSPYGLASGVFGADGFTDLVTTAFTDQVSPMILGDGRGGFRAGLRLEVEESPIDVVVGRFDGDSFADLAVVNFDSASVSILLGLGERQFAPAQNYAVGDLPIALTAADLNGDGALDLVTADSLGSGAFFNSVSILLGNGDGTFAEQALAFEVGSGPWGVAVADFNRDGAPDIVTANVESTTDPAAGAVSVLLQCIGDCDLDGRVSTADLVLGVRMALGDAPVDLCPTFDRNGDERITVNELVGAVNSALNVCVG